ncbi:aminoglycoside 6-adenylyltransferase [Aliagarivorans marinus]|uniref:aminoglycoside 6-adenylyltransferase n=1 Tax=Aliagarivorans marinus TaxID=561965 RepID=UPI000413FF9B|nr:aminoglycoside 6-adenylyltransferase [Aliagarivorans marinus]
MVLPPRFKQFEQALLEWGKQQDNIRAIIVVGSHARSYLPADEYSDIDILFVVSNFAPFEQSDTWLAQFGTPLISFVEYDPDTNTPEVRVVYEDGLAVDFPMLPAELVLSTSVTQADEKVVSMLKRGHQFILDKDGLTGRFSRVLQQQLPSRMESIEWCENALSELMFYCLNYAKKLRRGESWLALQGCNANLQWQMLALLEQVVLREQNGQVDTWYDGRFVERWLGDTWNTTLTLCYADQNDHSIAQALLNCQFFAKQIADRLGASPNLPFEHMEQLLKQTLDHLLAAQTHSHSAITLN